MRTFWLSIATAFLVTCVTGNCVASFVAAAPAKTEPQRLRWKGRTIRIALSNSLSQFSSNIKADSDVIGAIRRSIRAWQNAADIELILETSDKQSVSPPGVAGDGVSLITIAQSPENVLMFSKSPQADSAKTRVFYSAKGFITEADIALNPFQQFSTDGTYGTFDLESTLTHEIGHLLGLRHSGVLGSTMSGSILKNGTFGFIEFGTRTLSTSDIAAIRELYGGGDDDSCCGAISGKISLTTGRPAKNLRVWAEESETARVAAQTDTAPDGSFRLGGLPAATYSVFWQMRDDASGGSSGELGSVRVSKTETRLLNEKVVLRRSTITLNYAGINGQLADSAIPVSAGREYVIYLGGRNLDPKTISIQLNSPFFKVSWPSVSSQDFGGGISVVSFVVSVDADAPAGSYSIFGVGVDGSRTSMIGALNID